MKKFTHLHLHTEYSLLDGYGKIDLLLDKAVEFGMDAVAITDHGSMFGVIDFYKKAKSKGIKPIIGCEIYVSPNSYLSKGIADKKRYHLVLLAENQEGYQNLIKIVSEGYVNGFYYKPRVDKDVLRKYSKGIICLSACMGGEVQSNLNNDNYIEAKKAAMEYKEIFGEDNFFLELQDHGFIEQKRVNLGLEKLSKELGLQLVATNDVHYIEREHSEIHDVVLCIGTASTVNQEKRMKFPNDQFYFKSADEMAEIFEKYPEAIENTNKIADRCNVEFKFHDMHLPHFEVEKDHAQYLRELVFNGLRKKYGHIDSKIEERAVYELEMIDKMGFTDYFLIVWDFIAYAKQKDIPVGPGRGSAAGSIVSYALDITGIDPIKYNLIFERFLNPQRVSMPDIDIDFCYERREEVIEYVKRKYGEEKVAQIVTFGTMAARNAIRDVGRALEIDYSTVDRIAKQVPQMIGMTIKKALEISEDFKESYNSNFTNKKLIDYAMAVEGMPRHTSTHAAGVVIASKSVDEFVPLSRNGDQITTQYNMIELEELGLLKMDFLGLRTLTVIKDAIKLIKYNHGIDIDIEDIDENDPNVMEIFNKANTIGIFQFESEGMRAFLKDLKPTRFDDLVAANSLFRPGPMNEIPNYIKYRHNPEEVKYLDPSLESILDVTYGTIVYQEQVMQIVQKLGGYSLGEADNLRRAMGKKKMSVMEENRKYFVNGKEENGQLVLKGAVRNGIDEITANKIYDLMIDFAKYAFNKSHSAAYAFVAVQTAWLKAYYPTEFMAALLSSVMSDSAKISQYIREALRLNIEILPPNVNNSFKKFSVEHNKIRMGLSAIKNVGVNFIKAIIEERNKGKFKSFENFFERLAQNSNSGINKKACESLIYAGAMDGLDLNRAQMIYSYSDILDSNVSSSKKNLFGQSDIFSMFETDSVNQVPEIPELPKKELLQYEKEVLGIYISDHPFRPYEKYVSQNADFNVLDKINIQENVENIRNNSIIFGGVLIKKREMRTKSNKIMAFLNMEDLYGNIEVVVFPDIYDRYRHILSEDGAYIVRGNLQYSDIEEPKIIMRDCYEITQERLESSVKGNTKKDKKLYLQISSNEQEKYSIIRNVLIEYPGDNNVIIYFRDTKKSYTLKNLDVDLNRKELIEKLIDIVERDNFKIV